MILAVFALLVIVFVILPLVAWGIGAMLWLAFIGIVLGAIGRLIVPGYQPIGFLATICCGWAGSILGRLIYHAAGLGHFPAGILIEIGVAAAAVALWSGTHRRSVASGTRSALPR